MGHSGLIGIVYVGKEEIHMYVCNVKCTRTVCSKSKKITKMVAIEI